MDLTLLLSLITTLVISLLLVPIVKYVGDKLDIVAKQNHRTIHNKRIIRIGGLAIYLSFLVSAIIFLKTDRQINAILIGGFIVFLSGLVDDMYDLSPKIKFLFQIIAAIIIVFYGDISLKGFQIPFLPVLNLEYVSIGITMLWIIGITNAINFIDGLDGLCSGISAITLVSIAIISITRDRIDIASLSFILIGAIAGVWFYNFYPASIFLGDCGALFLGFMISVISLLGFGYKSTLFFNLGAPIVILTIPIMDTLAAIVRRKLRHKSVSEADREHMHHKLMFDLQLGHRNSVLLLYLVTALFSVCSYLYLFNKKQGFVLFICLLLIFEIFVEYTSLISRKYRPLLTVLNYFVNSDKLPMTENQQERIKTKKQAEQVAIQLEKEKIVDEERINIMKKNKNKVRLAIIVGLVLVLLAAAGSIYLINRNNRDKKTPEEVENNPDVYPHAKEETAIMTSVYEQLTSANESDNEEEEIKLAAVYFTLDFYTWSNKTNRNQVGGTNYVLPTEKNSFANYALTDYYTNFDEHYQTYGKEGMPEVENYEVISLEKSAFVYEATGNADTFDVTIGLTYVNKVAGMPTETLTSEVMITMIKLENKYYVVGVNYQNVVTE